MRLQIAAANWKMNCTLTEAKNLLEALSNNIKSLPENNIVVIAVPFPYLAFAKTYETPFIKIAAQNVHNKLSGAYTGEVSAAMLASIKIEYVLIGHSERRQYNHENDALLAEKVNIALANNITPIFCCGEALEIREAETQNSFVATQISNSLFHLNEDDIQKVVIAYEPIWAIGTGKTASSLQAQEMHENIRTSLSKKYSFEVSQMMTILYGGSVSAANAAEIFGQVDVDGGLVGSASLKADDFTIIANSLSA
jgi:triosephosphate isomerase (TIM)